MPLRHAAVALVVGLSLMQAGLASAVPVAQSKAPTTCPSGDPHGFEISRLVGKSTKRARRIAAPCEVRVVRRNGHDLPVTKDFSTARINVAVRRRQVVKVVGVF